MYYRLFDKQTGEYLHTGYNSRTLQEVTDDFLSYIEGDLDEDDYNRIESMSKYERLSIIESYEFQLERSKRKFKELEY